MYSLNQEVVITVFEDGLFTTDAASKVKDLWIRVKSSFKRSDKCGLGTRKAGAEYFRLSSALSCASALTSSLHRTFVRPHLDYCIQAPSQLSQSLKDCLVKVP